jgi:hypothetical protein
LHPVFAMPNRRIDLNKTLSRDRARSALAGPLARRLAMALLASIGLAATLGCASTSGDGWSAAMPHSELQAGPFVVGTPSRAGALVLPDPITADALNPYSSAALWTRGRNNEDVSARTAVAPRASHEFPVRPRPLERRIIFERWEQ